MPKTNHQRGFRDDHNWRDKLSFRGYKRHDNRSYRAWVEDKMSRSEFDEIPNTFTPAAWQSYRLIPGCSHREFLHCPDCWERFLMW